MPSAINQETFDYEMGRTLIERAATLRPLLAAKFAQNEIDGQIDPEVVDAYTREGLIDMSSPRRWGGLSISATDMAKVACELAKGCPSTAWVVSIANSNAWLASTLAEPTQRKIFVNGVPSLCGPQNGMGRIAARDGGYALTGKWAYASNSRHAVGCIVPCLDEDDQPKLAYMPMEDVEIEYTWKVAGMKATGSDTVIANDVPLAPDQFADLVGVCGDRNYSFAKEITDHWMAFPLLRSKALGVLVGAVYGQLDAVAATQERGIIYTNIKQKRNSPVFRARIGEIAAKIRSAYVLMESITRVNDIAAEEGREQTVEERILCRSECAMSLSLLHEASDQLMDLAGASGFADVNPVQRYWRDFNVGARHAIFNADTSYEVFGNDILGFSSNEPVVPELFV